MSEKKAKKTWDEKMAEAFPELQGDVSDLITQLEDALGDLKSADSCETSADFVANLRNCRATMKEVDKGISEILTLS